MNPKISIVIPCYNPKSFLYEAFVSIYAQTLKADEIIIVDDGSDNIDSMSIFDDIKKKYPDIIFISQKNKGISGAVNAGARKSSGEFVFMVDSDDVLDEKYIEKYMEVFNANPSIDAVTGPYVAFKGAGNHANVEDVMRTYYPKGLAVPDIFFDNCGGGSNSAFKKSMLEEVGYFDERYRSYQDWGMWLKMIAYDKKVGIISDPLYHYRVHDQSDLRTDIEKKSAELKDNIRKSLYDIVKKRPEFFVDEAVFSLFDHMEKLKVAIGKKNKELEIVTSSKFWKLRNLYMKIKKF